MFYDDQFILSLPDDVDEAMLAVLDRILTSGGGLSDDNVTETRDLIIALTQRDPVSAGGRRGYYEPLNSNDVGVLVEAFKKLRNTLSEINKTKRSTTRQHHFITLLGNGFAYTLSEADLSRIQVILNELRDLITTSDHFEDDHRRRVLDRLEGLQKELHRRLSSLDRFYGLIGDAGVLLGKFGHDAKPFVDRIREIVEIVWRSQANAEQLPASAKPALLTSEPSPDE